MLGFGLTIDFVGLPQSTVAPTASYSFLVDDTFPDITCTRSTEGAYINADGKYALASANVLRVHHIFGTGERRGVLNEEYRKVKNLYARPSADAVGDHFTAGSGNASVVTDATAPITDDYTNHDDVWELTNASGSAVTFDWDGTVGNTNVHNIQIVAKITAGSGYAVASLSGNDAPIGELRLNSREWAYYESLNITPGATTDKMRLVIPDGMTIRVMMVNVQEDSPLDARYYSHTTTFIDSNGTATFRGDEFLSRTGVGDLFGNGKGTVVIHGEFYGGENTNTGVLGLANSASPTEDYFFLRYSPAGQWLWFGEGGNTSNVAVTLPADASPTPAHVSHAFRWSSGNSRIAFQGTLYDVETATNMPDGLDTIYFYRHDTGTRNDSTCILTRFELYDVALSDAELQAKSKRKINNAVVTAGQSNADIYMRGFGGVSPVYDDGAKGGGEIFIERELYNYMANLAIIRGPAYEADYGGGALFKSTGSATVDYYIDDDGAEYAAGLDAIKVVNHINDTYNGPDNVYMIWDHWQYENAFTREEIETDYKAGMLWLFDYFNAQIDGNFKIYLQMPVDRFATDDDKVAAFREVYTQVASELSYVEIAYHPYKFDLAAGSNAHYSTEEDYIEMGRAVARFILADQNIIDLGNVTAPQVASIDFGGTSVRLNCTTENSAALTATTTDNLFRVVVNGVENAVNSFTVSGQTVVLTVADEMFVTDDVRVDYPFYLLDYEGDGVGGADPDGGVDENDSGQFAIVDDSAYAQPLANTSNTEASFDISL